MKVGIVDAECLLPRHRFPNLASMKISGYHKSLGDEVSLITDLNPDKFLNHNIVNFKKKYDRIYVSKIFVETSIPRHLLTMDMVMYGGSGFYFSDAENLNPLIEHFMPDYHLYDDWIAQQKALGSPDKEFRYYELYSMGYTTRGCVRQCSFCINKHCTKVEKASPIKEFFDIDKRNICLLDDNILAYEGWKNVFLELNSLNKMYEFKQGLDIRMLTEEKAEVLVKSNLNINGLYFAFDNVKEKYIIEEKLTLWRKHYHKHTSMYVLCGYDENGIYDDEFWSRDIIDTLERIKICMKYNIFPYIMRYKNFKSAPKPYYGMYVCLASWCNQKGTIVKYSFTEWVNRMQKNDEKANGKTKLYSNKRYYFEYSGKHPDIAYEYFDVCYDDISEYKYVRDNGANGKEKPENKPKTFGVKVNVIKKKVKENIKTVAKKGIDQIDKDKTLQIPEIFTKDIVNELPIAEDKVAENKQISNNLSSKTPSMTSDFSESFIKFSVQGFKDTPTSNVNLIILNSKDDIFTEYEKSTILFSELSLKDDGSLFVNNIDLKSFNLARKHIEETTTLKFKEVNTFATRNSKFIWSNSYCSRYSFSNDTNIFDTNKKYVRVSILEEIVAKCSKNGDIALNFFDRFTTFQNIGNIYYSRKWTHISKRSSKNLHSGVRAINKLAESKGIYLNKAKTIKEIDLNESNEQTFLDYYSKDGKKGLL